MRNAGNLIPHAHHFQDEYFSCEPAALELGCVVNDIRHIIVCGHSDCKAMNLLYQLRDPDFASKVCMMFCDVVLGDKNYIKLFCVSFYYTYPSLAAESTTLPLTILDVHTCQHQFGKIPGVA